MGNQNAVVVSQKTLSKMMACSLRTVQTAVSDLERENWIQIVRLNGPGSVAAYVVNDRVAFFGSRENLRYSLFSAAVVADVDDQPAPALEPAGALRKIPVLFPGEQQMPAGPGDDPPSQPSIAGLEPDLPAIVRDGDGREFTVDKQTGELQGRLI